MEGCATSVTVGDDTLILFSFSLSLPHPQPASGARPEQGESSGISSGDWSSSMTFALHSLVAKAARSELTGA